MLPPDALVLPIGPPAAGKSGWAAELVAAGAVAAGDVLATDAWREELTGSASDLSADRQVFARLRVALDERMAAGRTTVVDATNLWPRRRGRHIRVARAHGRPVVAVLFDVPLDALLERNTGRERAVPAGGLVLMHRQFATLRPALLRAEGCDHVLVRHDDGTMSAWEEREHG